MLNFLEIHLSYSDNFSYLGTEKSSFCTSDHYEEVRKKKNLKIKQLQVIKEVSSSGFFQSVLFENIL